MNNIYEHEENMKIRCIGSSRSSGDMGRHLITMTNEPSKTIMVGSSSSNRRIKSSESLIIEEAYKNISHYLPEDVLLKIFLYLPLESIKKFRCVSKLWRSLLSTRFFKSWLLNKFSTPSPWVMFYNLHCSATESVSIASLDPMSKFIYDHGGFSFKFLYSKICPYDKKSRIYLLASSNGVVLCSTNTAFQCRYYVCNPFTEKWVSLPRPKSDRAWVLNGLICEPSSSSLPSSYKVVRIEECKHAPWTTFNLELFSSNSGEWTTYQVSCPENIHLVYPFLSNVVSCDGVLYWVEGKNRLIAYDINNNDSQSGGGRGQCRLIDLPEKKKGYYCLGEIQTCLRYSRYLDGELSVWVLEDNLYGKGVWRLIHKIEIKDMLGEDGDYSRSRMVIEEAYHSSVLLEPLAFDPVDSNVVILEYWIKNWDLWFSYNMKTRRLQQMFKHNSKYTHVSRNGEVFPIVLKPRLTTLPPPSWSETHYTTK